MESISKGQQFHSPNYLAKHLPRPLETTYLVNSGTEAIEGALKLARRATGRAEILYANLAYHGNTMGA